MIHTLPQDFKPMGLYYGSRIQELTGHFERSLETADKLLEMVQKGNNEHQLGIVAKAYALWRLARFEEALVLLNSNIEDVSSSEETFSHLYNVRGLIFWKLGDNRSALQDFQRAVNLRKSSNLMGHLSYSMNNIGNTYLNMGNMDSALDYYSESLKLRKELKINPGIAASYNSFGRYYEKTGNKEMALENYTKSLEIWSNVGNNQFIAKSYRFLGTFYIKVEKYESGLEYLRKANDLFSTIPNITDAYLTSQILKKVESLIP